MQPANFPESNRTLTKPSDMTAEECSDLHIWTDGQTCISLWRPSLLERLSILLFGRIWLFVRSGPTQPPATLDAHRAIFQEEPAHAQ